MPLFFCCEIEYAAMKIFAFIIWLSLLSTTVVAGGVYQEPDAFIAEAFADDPPKPGLIWPTSELKADMKAILGHDYPSLRIRYWQKNGRTAWILDEIGKDKPITTGFVIDQGLSLIHI